MNFISALVLLFIYKIMNPRNTNIYDYLNKKYGNPVLGKYRKIVKLNIKLCKVKLDICMNYNLYPKFLNFKLSIKRLQGSHLQRQCQRRILYNEVKFKKSKLKQETRLKEEITREFRNSVSLITYYISNFWAKEYVKKYSEKVKITHNKKLLNLGYNNINHPPTEKVIFNFSNKILSKEEESVLSIGLYYCLTPSKIKLIDHYTPFEKLAFNLSTNDFHKKTVERESNFNSEIKNIAKTSFNNINKSNIQKNLSSKQIKILKELSSNKEIIILKPDKGNGIVILNKVDYGNKIKQILNDTEKFQIINEDIVKLTHKLEDKVTRFL